MAKPALTMSETSLGLVRRARQGDPSAFADLARTYLRPAYATALAIVGRREEAEEIAQAALSWTLARITAFGVASHFSARLLQRVRKQARHFVRGQPRAVVVPALLGLDERAREVLLLHDLAGWPLWQIAESLSLCEAESRRQLFEARRFLHARGINQSPSA
jgi:DNA-directed RNA polymerase specialized sigma24 family protein